jgi:hypothetical protein
MVALAALRHPFWTIFVSVCSYSAVALRGSLAFMEFVTVGIGLKFIYKHM